MLAYGSARSVRGVGSPGSTKMRRLSSQMLKGELFLAAGDEKGAGDLWYFECAACAQT